MEFITERGTGERSFASPFPGAPVGIMAFDSRDTAKRYLPQEGDTLQKIAERETAAGNAVTWQEIARFNWGTADEAEVDNFLRDVLGARNRGPDGHFVLSSEDAPRGHLLIPKPFARRGLAPARTYTLRVRRKHAPPQFLGCCSLPGITFAFNSAFVRPNVAAYLSPVEALAKAHPEARIMIFGHTDAVGSDLYNKKLSERRAWSVYAFITNDAEAWEVLYNHPDEDWGLAVVQEILSGLGYDAGPADGDWGPQTRAAIRTFLDLPSDAPVQNDGGLRRQLFTAYMSGAHDVDLPTERFMDPGYMGCGEFNPVTLATADQQQNRRVTFFFFHPERLPVLPCAFADTSPCRSQIDAAGPRFTESFRCSFMDSLARTCNEAPPPPSIVPTIRFVEVMPPLEAAADIGQVDTWGGANFAPPLGHHVHFRVEVRDLPAGFEGTVQLEIVRRGGEASKPFVVVTQLKEKISGDGQQQVVFTWDGRTDSAVEAHLSERTTPGVGAGNVLHIPVPQVCKGKWVPHGLYHVKRVTLLDSGEKPVDEDQPQDVSVGVPVLVTLRFNKHWRSDVKSFGLEHFREDIEQGIRRYCQDVYSRAGAHVRFLFDATRTSPNPPGPLPLGARHNVKVDAGRGEKPMQLTHDRTILVDIGGVDSPIPFDDAGNKKFRIGATKNLTFFDSTCGGRQISTPKKDFANIFVQRDGDQMSRIYVTQLMRFNDWSTWGVKTTKFRATFFSLGVRMSTGELWTDNGGIRTRWVSGNELHPKRALTSEEAKEFVVAVGKTGMASVTASQPATKAATRREAQIQRALRHFVLMVGNTVVHEVGHALGLVAPRKFKNGTTRAVRFTDGTVVLCPLAGDPTHHSLMSAGFDIMAPARTVPFDEFVEPAEFNASNGQYLSDCLPSA